MVHLFKHKLVWCVSILVALCLAPLFMPYGQTEVDIKTGRIRLSQRIVHVRVSEQIKDSPLSEVLPREMIEKTEPDWHVVSTTSPLASYRYGHTISQMNELAELWKLEGVSKSVKRKTALHLLAIWQLSGSTSLADRYLFALERPDKVTRKEAFQSSERLEMPEDRTSGEALIRTVYFPDGSPLTSVHGYLDAKGGFVKHGVWESWYPNGKRETYGHFERGDHHGQRYEWNEDGKLICIEKFYHNNPMEYQSEHFERHPEYENVRRLTAEHDSPAP